MPSGSGYTNKVFASGPLKKANSRFAWLWSEEQNSGF
jgi:hypothetical protein